MHALRVQEFSSTLTPNPIKQVGSAHGPLVCISSRWKCQGQQGMKDGIQPNQSRVLLFLHFLLSVCHVSLSVGVTILGINYLKDFCSNTSGNTSKQFTNRMSKNQIKGHRGQRDTRTQEAMISDQN